MKESFEKVYMEEKKSILLAIRKYSRELKIDQQEMESLLNFEFWRAYNDYDESVGKVVFKTFYSRRLKQRAYDNYRKKERKFYESADRIDRLRFENDDEENAATFEIVDDFNLEEHVITRKTKKADQHKLIDFLVSGENERTTAIVRTYLTTELKTPTAIGKHLGLDHKQVSRAVERLAGKFDSKQFGEYQDYLIAL